MRHRPTASVSFDLDNIWSFLKTHGDPEWEQRPSYLRVAVPRMVDFLGELSQSSTVFVIGADAERDDGARAVNEFAAAGHEIGNHSFEHEPWLSRYSRTALEEEIDRTDNAIVAAGGKRPRGFRGPGYSVTPTLLELLVERGYDYDASTLPTWIGPLARAYHFRTSTLTDEQREDRSGLFGSMSEGRRPLRPYQWTIADSPRGITELPVTTMPLTRVPIHGSYLVQLYSISPRAARAYFSTAVRLCRLRGVGMSMLLHPTDLLDRRDAPALDFFPGMDVSADDKYRFMSWVVAKMQGVFDVVNTAEHVARAAQNGLPESGVHRAAS